MTNAATSGSGEERSDHGAWPARALLLAVLGAVFGAAFSQLVEPPETAGGAALATVLAVSGVTFALSLERLRSSWSAIFATGAGAVAGFVGWWNGAPGQWGADEGWHFAAVLGSAALAVPLFQAARDEGGARFPAGAVHGHAWTNLILGGVAGAFVGATLLLTVLLGELFALIGLDFLRELIRRGWFLWSLACAAFGGAIGLLRDRDAVMAIVQRVVRAILSVLAPVLAAGLLFFVLALPFTGLQALWEQTKSTTPILLICIGGAVLLINAAAGNSHEEEARAPVLRWSAAALAAVMLPLAVVAAVSTAKRIGQYGYTPDRLWAAVFVAVAAAFGFAYLIALLRGRARWMERLRDFNVRLAAGVCLLAFFLALPLVSFGSLSARDQLARLQSGKVSASEFDWAALRFDFGPAGRRALERLAASGPYRAYASKALAAESRWAVGEGDVTPPQPPKLRVDGGAAVPADLLAEIATTRRCASGQDSCRLAFVDAGLAVLVAAVCDTCSPQVMVFEQRPDSRWGPPTGAGAPDSVTTDTTRVLAEGRIEVRTIARRQVFLDGKPVGEIFN